MKPIKINFKLEESFKSIIIGTFMGICSMFLIILAISFIPLKIDLPVYTYKVLTIIALLVSAFIAGYINGKKIKRDGIVVGMITSILFIVIFLLLKLFFSDLYNFSSNTLFKIMLVTITCLISSIIGVNKKNKRIRY